MSQGQSAVDLDDPRWYPADLDIAGGRIAMLQIDEDVVERSTFMDARLDADLAAARIMDLKSAINPASSNAKIAWLLHTSFCCSTLLARALSTPPQAMVFREPLVLRRLADARNSQQLSKELFDGVVRLLGRPWAVDGCVLVKPTHAALNISRELLQASPDSRVLVLTSSLDDFLVSNLKKTAETQARIPLLVERALQAGSWHRRLPQEAFSPPSLIAAAGLQWAAQRELLLETLKSAGDERVRVLSADALLADVPAVTVECARWLQLPVNAEDLAVKAEAMAGRHAKVETRVYGAAAREAEVSMIASMFSDELKRSRRWLDSHVLPVMNTGAIELERGFLSLLN